jgi:hypothetical protein
MRSTDDKIAQLRTMIVIVELVRLRDASASLATFPSSAVIREWAASHQKIQIVIVQSSVENNNNLEH